MRHARIGGLYAANIIATALIGLISMPALIRSAGPEAWGSLAAAQASGALFATVVAFGWGVFGPTYVAQSSSRGSLYVESLVVRGALLVAMAAPFALATATLVPATALGAPVVLLYGAIPMLGALGATWFFVGESRPDLLLLADALPRIASTALGLLALQLGNPTWTFVVLQVAGTVLAAAISALCVLRRYPAQTRLEWTALLHNVRRSMPGVGTSLTASAYVNLPVVIVGVLLPTALPTYAMADKLLKIASAGLSPVSQVAQGYVPLPGSPVGQAIRAWRAIRWATIASFAAALAFALLSDFAATLLSNGTISIPPAVAIFFGIALACTLLSGIVGRACLAAFGRESTVFTSTVVGALLGVGLIVLACLAGSIVAVAAAIAAAELCVLGIQVLALRRLTGELR